MDKRILCLALTMAATINSTMAQEKGENGIGIKLSNMNNAVDPGQSFYDYACGGWIKNNPLPAAYSRFGSFENLNLKCDKQVNGIMEELKNGSYAKGTNEQKISDLYKMAMDSTRLNREGVKPLMPYLKEVADAKTREQQEDLTMKYAFCGAGSVYGLNIGADEKDSKNNIFNIYQSGLTLDQKEYYLDNDSATASIREEYKKYIVKMFKLFGFSEQQAQQKMQYIMHTETELAKASRNRTQLRDPEKNYNKMTIEEVESKYPNLNITRRLLAKGAPASSFKTVIVGQPEFLERANSLMGEISTEERRAYLEWDFINSASSLLSDEVEDARFDFFGRVMAGRKQNFERWKRATNFVQGQMGQAIGKIYVEKYFPASSKEKMLTLVKNLQKALGQRIDAQSWMSDTTKAAAHEKLSTFFIKIGYPNKWKDYSDLTIDPSLSLFDNVMAYHKFASKQEIEEKAGKPVDNEEWFMNPQTVNAYYNPTTNEICFPAGILQYPFFDPTADEAFNYGAIGMVIGHEMTHGFDDQGRMFDKDGNMKDWWTASDANNFKERTDRYADFYSNIKVLPDLNANGRLTLGENLADHGGLQVAYQAYLNATEGKTLPTVSGLTPDQRFFLSYAGVWAENINEAELRKRVKSDPHSMGRWRVDGALPHIDAWYKAFNIKPGEKMYLPKSERLDLW